MSKLTLHVDEHLVAAAKKEAATRQVSVSKLVSDFFRVLEKKRADKTGGELPPVTKSLLGSIQGANADEENYIDYLEKKYS